MFDLKQIVSQLREIEEEYDFPIQWRGVCERAAELLEEQADLSLRIAVAMKLLELTDTGYPHPGCSKTAREVLTMPIESLHEFIKNNPQYGDV